MISRLNSPSSGFHAIKEKMRMTHGWQWQCSVSLLLPVLCHWGTGLTDITGDPSDPWHDLMSVFCSFQLLSYVRIFTTPWTAACQSSLPIIYSWSLLKLVSIELVMPSNHLILCRPFLLLPSIFPSIRVFSKESILCIRWLKYWSFSFSITPSNECSELIFFRMD